MADIAIVFHWPPSEMWAMALPELLTWHDLAMDRWQQVNAQPEGQGR